MFCSTDELRAKLHSYVVVVSYRKEEPIKAQKALVVQYIYQDSSKLVAAVVYFADPV